MSEESIRQLAEHKLIILHLLQKMGIALSNSEICQFLLEKNYMDYFSIQQYLTELVDAGWLEKSWEQNNTRYTLTDEGDEIVNYFPNTPKTKSIRMCRKTASASVRNTPLPPIISRKSTMIFW